MTIVSEQNIFLKLTDLISDDLRLMDELINLRIKEREELIYIVSDHLLNSGGKRIRPILTILAAKLFSYTGNYHLNLAAAVEFIHTATLLHDDVVDESSYRRGKLSAKEIWGNKASILVGDFLFSQSFRLMAETGDMHVLDILSETSAIIAEGEVMQLVASNNLALSLNKYFSIISAKTAALFAAACQVGAALGKANSWQEQQMHTYGTNMGVSFQIMDDILDYAGDNTTLGKNIGNDFKEHKVTLPVIIAYSQSNTEEKLFWQEAFANDHADFQQAQNIINKYNALDQSYDYALQFCKKAEQAILSLNLSNQYTDYFLELIKFSIKRSY